MVNLVSSPEIYTHDWASFPTQDFPENSAARSGDVVRIIVTDHHDRRPVEDILGTDESYREICREAGLEAKGMFKPLAKGDEPYRWVNEAKLAPGVIYVLKRAELEIRLADLFLSAECEHEQASTNLGNHHRRGASMAQTYDPVAKLNELIKGIEFAMLTTIRPSGRLHSCPMATTEAEGDGVLWFFSGNNTEKVEAIKTDPRVNLAYSDASSQRYVSITGNAEPVRDHVKAKELWKPLYNAWFPMGLQDPNLILLKVNIQVAEYWDATAGSMVLLAGFAN